MPRPGLKPSNCGSALWELPAWPQPWPSSLCFIQFPGPSLEPSRASPRHVHLPTHSGMAPWHCGDLGFPLLFPILARPPPSLPLNWASRSLCRALFPDTYLRGLWPAPLLPRSFCSFLLSICHKRSSPRSLMCSHLSLGFHF